MVPSVLPRSVVVLGEVGKEEEVCSRPFCHISINSIECTLFDFFFIIQIFCDFKVVNKTNFKKK